ncbi:hypothetical protein V6N12_030636 [Hibiscus sabdariffa]|uniref:Uncharacterized protein n=1 Tax=Hibiscus sabdariffa TaxID=183260 RepID=A0ABR1ZSL9_9ROSI
MIHNVNTMTMPLLASVHLSCTGPPLQPEPPALHAVTSHSLTVARFSRLLLLQPPVPPLLEMYDLTSEQPMIIIDKTNEVADVTYEEPCP